VIIRWKHIPSSEKEVSIYSREFWIFLGATTLCLMGFQVLIPTSYPVINKIAGLVGINSNLAPPGNQIEAYSKFQLWFGVAVALISGTGQFFWWKKLDTEGLKKQLLPPILITLILFALIIAIGKVYKPAYLCLVLASTYIIVSNAFVIGSLIKLNPKLSGGAVAHIGIGLMLLGVLASAGYSKVVSLNNTGLLYAKEAGTEFNRDNLLLFINETRTMAGYDIEYLGERIEPTKKNGFIKKSDVVLTNDPFKVVAKKELIYKGNTLFSANDTVEINPENTYYEIELRKNGKLEASLFPRIQINESMGGRVASPDIKRNMFSDLYTHVSAPMDPEAEVDWGKTEELKITYGKDFFVNDYVAQLEEVKRLEQIDGIELSKEDVAVQARIKIQGEHDIYYAEPIFIIKDRSQVGRIPSEVNDLGIKLTLLNIHPETNEFSFAVNQRQKDWVIIKTLEKPMINVLWLGTGVLMIGFCLAMIRRFKEFNTK